MVKLLNHLAKSSLTTRELARTLTLVAVAVNLSATLISPASAKSNSLSIEKIQINADQATVFEALRKYRNAESMHRKCVSFDGHSAVIDEHLNDVPVLGKVHCVWIEHEISPERIDYTMTESDKFTSGCGSYIISAPLRNGSLMLEMQSKVETGLHIPFAHELSLAATHRDMRTRLNLLKQIAEADSQTKKIASLK